MSIGGVFALLVFGIILIIGSVFSLISCTGDGVSVLNIGMSTPDIGWPGWIFLPIGITFCIVSIRALLLDKKKPKYTEEEIAQSKADYERRYLEKHGVLPDEENKDA